MGTFIKKDYGSCAIVVSEAGRRGRLELITVDNILRSIKKMNLNLIRRCKSCKKSIAV